MSEIRRDPFSNEWVLLAPNRSRRPLQQREEGCPFCPGYEERTPPEVYRYPEGEKRWQIRVIPNKYPALSSVKKTIFYQGPLYLGGSGVGEHQVIVEHRDHNLDFYDYSREHLREILMTYQISMASLFKKRAAEYVVLFKNSGTFAGATISHPHSQILSLPFTPVRSIERLKSFQRFEERKRECLMCRLLLEEIERREHMIDENHHFLAISPYASLHPYQIWVVPRHHSRTFLQEKHEELDSLSSILKRILLSMESVLKRPSFNMYFHVPPRGDDLYHWHLELIPRLTTMGGFEGASGVMINPVDPKKAAERLKKGLTIF